MFTAVVRISGAGRLADFRERLRWLMVRDPDAEDYTEHHAEGLLEYRFTPRRGIPFPAFAAASAEFPELSVEAQWEHDGARGRALIENGRVVQEDAAPATPGVEVSAGEDGRIELALVMQKAGAAWRGYAATAERHTYFRCANGEVELVDPQTPEDALEELALEFVGEWIWYDEEEAPVERARYADYGYPVRGANLRSEKLAFLRRRGSGRYSTLDDEARRVRETLLSKWQSPA